MASGKEKEKTYEEEMKELEDIVEKITSSSCTLSESLLLFEKGEELSKSIYKRLKNFEGKIQILNKESKKFEDVWCSKK